METWQVVLKEYDSETWILKNFSLKNFFILITYMFAIVFLAFGLGVVHKNMAVPFVIFNFIFATYFVQSSPQNKGLKNYQSLILIIKKPKTIFTAAPTKYKHIPQSLLSIDREANIALSILNKQIKNMEKQKNIME